MTIRRATINDIDGILRLLRQIFIIHARLRPDLFATRTKRTKYDAIELADIIADSEERPLFVVCDDNGEVIAYAMCIVEHSPNGIITLYIDDLCVDMGHHILWLIQLMDAKSVAAQANHDFAVQHKNFLYQKLSGNIAK